MSSIGGRLSAWAVLGLLSVQWGCAGKAAQSDGSTSGLAGSGSALPTGSAGAGSVSASGAGDVPDPPPDMSSNTAGASAGAAGTATGEGGLTETASDAELEQAGLADAGCHVVSRDISCIRVQTQS